MMFLYSQTFSKDSSTIVQSYISLQHIIYDVDAKDADDYNNNENDNNDDDADDHNNDDDNNNNDDNKNNDDKNDLAISLHQLSSSVAVPGHIGTLPDIIILCW